MDNYLEKDSLVEIEPMRSANDDSTVSRLSGEEILDLLEVEFLIGPPDKVC